jgi:hypothetical protein
MDTERTSNSYNIVKSSPPRLEDGKIPRKETKAQRILRLIMRTIIQFSIGIAGSLYVIWVSSDFDYKTIIRLSISLAVFIIAAIVLYYISNNLRAFISCISSLMEKGLHAIKYLEGKLFNLLKDIFFHAPVAVGKFFLKQVSRLFLFLWERRKVILISLIIALIGFAAGLLIQKYRYENVKKYRGKEGRIVNGAFYSGKTNIKIFNANKVRGSERKLGKELEKKIPGVHCHYQDIWILKRIYDRTIIVYIKNDYRDQALLIANLLDGHQTVIPYRNTPFFGLEKRDIAIFIGTDLENKQWDKNPRSNLIKGTFNSFLKILKDAVY